MTALAVSLGRATRGIDRVALAILAILAALALLAPPQALESLRFAAASLLEVAPFSAALRGRRGLCKGEWGGQPDRPPGRSPDGSGSWSSSRL